MNPLYRLKTGLNSWVFICGILTAFSNQPAEACRSPVVCPTDLLKDGLGNVSLFSAISLQNSGFAAQWGALLPQLRTLFPSLTFENPRDLHISEIYMGYNWDPNQVSSMERYALVSPPAYPMTLQGTPTVFGGSSTYVVLELNPVASSWANQIVNNTATLTKLGLRKLDAYDGSFVPHITLAAAQGSDANGEIAPFQQWLTKNSSSLGNFSITLNATDLPELLISIYGNQDQYYFPFHDICR